MRSKAVFFDFGGTLVSPLPDLASVFRAAARRAGVQLPMAEFLRANEEVWAELWPDAPRYLGRSPSFADTVHAQALEKVHAVGPLDRMVVCIRDEAVSPRAHPPFPEAEAVLRHLRARDVPVHVLSNNVDYLPLLLSNLGWTELFDSVTFSQEIAVEKPDSRIFRLGLGRAACEPSEALYVGDSWTNDYQGALNAGMRAVWVNRARAKAPESCLEVHDLTGIPALL